MWKWYNDESKWWNIKNTWEHFCHNVFSPFRRFFYWFGKSCQYARFLWNDADFDYSSILRLLQYKIGRVRKTIYENNLIENTDFYTRQMIMAETMLEELIEDDFARELHDAHDAKWGKLQWKDNPNPGTGALWRANVKTPADRAQEHKEAGELMNEEERLRAKAYHDTFVFISKYVRYWWD
jgi:hypothetical protein